MAVAALLVVIGLLVGVIVGVLVAPGGSDSTSSTTGITNTAPSLTSDQIESGELPAGHPEISGAASETPDAGTN